MLNIGSGTRFGTPLDIVALIGEGTPEWIKIIDLLLQNGVMNDENRICKPQEIKQSRMTDVTY